MTAAGRRELRRELVSRIPGSYAPWLHLLLEALLCLAVLAGAIALVRDPRPWELALVPAFLVAGNAIEWHLHRGLLHRHVRFFGAVYRAHAQHHRLFSGDDLTIHELRELRFVLLPTPVVLIACALALPVAIALRVAGEANLAALWVASAAAYVLAYEWLHLCYHLPAESPLGRLAVIRALRRHHALHHSTRLMVTHNLSVTFPLWDWVRGTAYRPRHATPATKAAAH
jgi:hypothetical protein